MIEKRLNDDVQKKKTPTAISEILAKFFTEKNRNEKMNRITISYILTLMEKTNVYDGIFNNSDLAKFQPYKALFNKNIFPPDPTSGDYEFDYVKKINILLFKWIEHLTKDKQQELYNEIYDYVFQEGINEKVIYNFLPLFWYIMTNSSLELYLNFIDTKLFTTILVKSEKDIVLFDISRYLIARYSTESLESNKSLQTKIPDFYFDKKYKPTVIAII